MKNKFTENQWQFFTIFLLTGLILGILFDPIRLHTPKTSQGSLGLDPVINWEAIPPGFPNLDVKHLSSPKNCPETEFLIGALITKQMSDYPIICDWEPIYSQGNTFWLYVAFQPVSEDQDEMLTPRGHGFLIMHHEEENQLDGYFIPIGEDLVTMVYPFGDMLSIGTSDLPEQLMKNLQARAQDPSTEPLIVQNSGDLLRK